MKLQLATWPDIEAYLERCDAVLIPIGSTEQHGPTGLIGTDAICPEHIAAGLAEQGVHLIGRYGAWTYSYMERAILDGMELAERLTER